MMKKTLIVGSVLLLAAGLAAAHDPIGLDSDLDGSNDYYAGGDHALAYEETNGLDGLQEHETTIDGACGEGIDGTTSGNDTDGYTCTVNPDSEITLE